MKTVCKIDTCTGCKACRAICPKDAITIEDSLMAYNAIIDPSKCIKCNACHIICQKNTKNETTYPILWKQGWCKNAEERAKSSSGGVAAAIARNFIQNKGLVCSCTFNKGRFGFEFAYKVDELEKYLGSKYVKSDPDLIFRDIKDKLKNGEKVLFIGLPCQVAGLKKYIGTRLADRLYTIDLICHGSPSPTLLDKYLNQYNTSLLQISRIEFRRKGSFGLRNPFTSFVSEGVRDKYTMAFLNGLCYTENCYECQFAKIERVSDLTVGDSWGSELSEDEKKKGISLLICQTEKGKELLRSDELYLTTVDIKKAILANHQLYEAFPKPIERELFFKAIRSGKSFNFAVRKCYPKVCMKQDIKDILIRMHLIGGV